MLYEIATLDIANGAAPTVAEGIQSWTKASDAKGRLLGCFAADVGMLNQAFVLREFATRADLEAERQRTWASANPFHCGNVMSAMVLDSYALFPFVPPPKPGAYGGVYEFRSYKVKHGGLPETLKLWEQWLPGRVALTPLLAAMYRLDGAPGYTHIWPYADAGARAKTRAEAVSKGLWPPKGGAVWLAEMRSTLTVPLAGSPLT
jgi:hypothetical protein